MTKVKKYGFELIRKAELSEINATLYKFIHQKSGAELVYLDRDDENKTFSIGFATPPENDTGVFHIIEHSVLCGSKKYPLNDPFAELLKGSLNTFLNAGTYADRTVYPVSSRCERDFLNLVDVYMDAVFSPNMLENLAIFMQEGWHYEYDEENNSLSYNGVVYNEMKGAYSSPDELGAECLSKALFGGTPYGCDSGGNPDNIPELSYEMFKKTHEKYYHPSRAKIILDGKMDLDKILSLIDSHLCPFDKREIAEETEKICPKITDTVEIKYEISENEDESDKARVLYGFIYADYFDKEANLSASVLSDILCGSNASPLKKALLERDLAKDVAMYSLAAGDHTLILEIRDTDKTKLDEIDKTITEVVSSLVNNGIDKNNIISSLNSIEFRLRERDYGAFPTGIVLSIAMYADWVRGGECEDAILLDKVVGNVRERIDSNYFEDALRSMILENKQKAKVIMLPDKTLGERKTREEKEKLDKILSQLSKEELQKIKDDEKMLREWQQAEPSQEALNSIPKLTLDDIPKKINRPESSVSTADEVKILKCSTKTNGIVYISLLFDASDLAGEELLQLSMLSSALLNYPTENRDALSLQNDIKANLGSLFASFTVGIKDGIATPYLKIGAKALTSKTDDILRLTGELLLTSKIEDTTEMTNLVAQAKSHIEDMIISSGESIGLLRVEASYDETAAISEYLSGYEAYRILSEINGKEEKISELTKSVANLLKKLINRNRLTVAITGDVDDEFISHLISLIPKTNTTFEKKTTALCAENNEYFLLPTKVAYAVIGGKSNRVEDNLGLMRVARSILSYEYLWNTVRVQSGAYGTGFVPRKNGSISFYSYRDPSPSRSISFYRESSDYLRSVAERGDDITKFIIGAIGEYDTLITPRTAATISVSDYLNGWSADNEAKVRSQMLNMTCQDLCIVADIIDEAMADKRQVIVGGEEHLEKLISKPDRIIKI